MLERLPRASAETPGGLPTLLCDAATGEATGVAFLQSVDAPLPTDLWQNIMQFMTRATQKAVGGLLTVKRAADQPEPEPQNSTQPSDQGERYEIVKDAVAALKRAAKVRETDVAVAKADMDDKEGAFSRANAALSRNASARHKKAKTEAKSAFDKAKNHHEKTRLMNEGTKRAVVRGDNLLRTIKKPRRQ